jgi:hypothetical protein
MFIQCNWNLKFIPSRICFLQSTENTPPEIGNLLSRTNNGNMSLENMICFPLHWNLMLPFNVCVWIVHLYLFAFVESLLFSMWANKRRWYFFTPCQWGVYQISCVIDKHWIVLSLNFGSLFENVECKSDLNMILLKYRVQY